MSKRFLIIGSGKYAIDCLRVLQRSAGECPVLVLAETERKTMGITLSSYCARNEIEHHEYEKVNSIENLKFTQKFRPDFCLSLNNFQIIKEPLLSAAKKGAINFHNGPLPRYGGVNICSWAIINGEKEYGVTWHFMDEGIDTGAIIAQRFFPIPDDATGLSLTMQCANVGIGLFEEILPMLVDGVVPSVTIKKRNASYFGKKDIPFGGRIDFRWPYDKLDRFVRGLSFHPFPSQFVYARTSYASRDLTIIKVSPVRLPSKSHFPPGTITAISATGIVVAVYQAFAMIEEVLDDELANMPIAHCVEKYGMKIGGRFDLPSSRTE